MRSWLPLEQLFLNWEVHSIGKDYPVTLMTKFWNFYSIHSPQFLMVSRWRRKPSSQKDWNSCPLVDESSAQPLELPPQPCISTAYMTDPSARVWFYCQVVKSNWLLASSVVVVVYSCSTCSALIQIFFICMTSHSIVRLICWIQPVWFVAAERMGMLKLQHRGKPQ